MSVFEGVEIRRFADAMKRFEDAPFPLEFDGKTLIVKRINYERTAYLELTLDTLQQGTPFLIEVESKEFNNVMKNVKKGDKVTLHPNDNKLYITIEGKCKAEAELRIRLSRPYDFPISKGTPHTTFKINGKKLKDLITQTAKLSKHIVFHISASQVFATPLSKTITYRMDAEASITKYTDTQQIAYSIALLRPFTHNLNKTTEVEVRFVENNTMEIEYQQDGLHVFGLVAPYVPPKDL